MRSAAAVIWLLVVLLAPSPVLAHSLVGRAESPLPLIVYLAGAALAVALSFAFVMLRDSRRPAQSTERLVPVPLGLATFLRVVGLVAWVWIVAQVIIGGSSDADVASLFLWVYGWVGLAIISAFVAPAWNWIDPFSTLFDVGAWIVRRSGMAPIPPVPYPSRLGAWPAVAALAFFVWLELAYVSQPGLAMIGYTVLTLAAMAYFGKDAWRANGEVFSIWFGMLNRLARYGPTRDELVLRRRPFGSGLLEPGWTLAHIVLVSIGTASIIYDGLSQTQIYFDLFGMPSLDLATLLLIAFLSLVAAIVIVVSRMVGVAAIGAGLVPVAAGYLVAHYATFLLGDGQRIVIALSDPLQLGWDLFGTAFFEPSTAWIPASLLWTLMLGAVIGGHVLGAWAGHAQTTRDAQPGQRMIARQLPLAILMVVLTATTLWSLGQRVVRDPGQTPSAFTAPIYSSERRAA